MKKFLLILTISLFILPLSSLSAEEFRKLPVDTYIDKMKAGWIGQMAGVGWGGPTEFRYRGQIIPEEKMPKWKPEMINQFEQDDIYVEMTFLRTLELYGFDASIRQAGIDLPTVVMTSGMPTGSEEKTCAMVLPRRIRAIQNSTNTLMTLTIK